MSHFCVLVRVPAKTRRADLEEVVGQMLLPYKESLGKDDPPELKAYFRFVDVEEEMRKEYETDTTAMVRLADGSEVSAYDDQFRNPEFSPPQFIYPEEAAQFEKPVKDVYPTFDDYMRKYHGYKPKLIGGRMCWGYYSNPNAKWDWWSLGGRWTGHLAIGYEPSKDQDNYKPCYMCSATGTRSDGMDCSFSKRPTAAGHPVIGHGCNVCGGTGHELKWPTEWKKIGNYVRLSQIDWEKVNADTVRRLDEFWNEWQELCAGKEWPPFDGPRDRALSLGLIECKDVKELTGNEWKVQYWDKPETPEDQRRNRCDVLRLVTKEWLIENFLEAFCPLSCWARVDDTGWHEKGRMGWWASNDATPESVKEYSAGLIDWMKSGDQDDWCVVVDCHI